MKITINIETQDPTDLGRISAALSGVPFGNVSVTNSEAVAAAKSARAVKAADAPVAKVEQAPQAEAAPAPAHAEAAPAVNDVPTEADIVAAANAAVAALGAGGPDKVKKYIAENFTKADGSPGTLKLTDERQRAELLSAMQKIGRKEIAL